MWSNTRLILALEEKGVCLGDAPCGTLLYNPGDKVSGRVKEGHFPYLYSGRTENTVSHWQQVDSQLGDAGRYDPGPGI